MIRMDLRNWTPPPADFDCINQAEEVQPVRTFTNGMENEMMLLRICAMFEPIFPLSGLGRDLKSNSVNRLYRHDLFHRIRAGAEMTPMLIRTLQDRLQRFARDARGSADRRGRHHVPHPVLGNVVDAGDL